jgi:hypothetical protein
MMAVMSVKDALDAVLQDIEAMSVEELRVVHEDHRNGDIAMAMRELHSYVGARPQIHEYPIDHVEAISIPSGETVAVRSALAELDEWQSVNEGCFALAA